MRIFRSLRVSSIGSLRLFTCCGYVELVFAMFEVRWVYLGYRPVDLQNASWVLIHPRSYLFQSLILLSEFQSFVSYQDFGS